MSIAEKKETDGSAAPGAAVTSPSSSSIAEFAGVNEKSLLRKLDLRLLPPLILLYLLSFLDRSNGLDTFTPAWPHNVSVLIDGCSWKCPVGRNDK
ncbi:hypothetical protein F1880_003106 [Penicillium rolfsii]|nr:hypothetical protein F1880_003106 [Penicillium rolfsii]